MNVILLITGCLLARYNFKSLIQRRGLSLVPFNDACEIKCYEP